MYTANCSDEAPLMAAREIVKHLDGAENFELPLVVLEGDMDTRIELDYDGVVDIIENIIRYYFNLEPNNEIISTTTSA